MNDAEKNNLLWWNEVTPGHVEHYGEFFVGVDEFLNGKTTLPDVQLKELGNLKNKKLLHLQCHFGLDTLSLAREGAIVTGIDFSDASIEEAKILAEKASIDARFICSNVYDLKEVLKDEKHTFDFVYTSQGVLCWLKDINEWARIISFLLKDGGTFYIQDSHPFCNPIGKFEKNSIKIEYPYFSTDKPSQFPAEWGDYANAGFIPKVGTIEWHWSMGEVVTALINAGLRIEFLHEYDNLFYQWHDEMVKTDKGWVFPDLEGKLPLTFTLKATKR